MATCVCIFLYVALLSSGCAPFLFTEQELRAYEATVDAVSHIADRVIDLKYAPSTIPKSQQDSEE